MQHCPHVSNTYNPAGGTNLPQNCALPLPNKKRLVGGKFKKKKKQKRGRGVRFTITKDWEVVAFQGIFKHFKALKAVKIPEIRIFPSEYTFRSGFTPRSVVKQNPRSLFSAGGKHRNTEAGLV